MNPPTPSAPPKKPLGTLLFPHLAIERNCFRQRNLFITRYFPIVHAPTICISPLFMFLARVLPSIQSTYAFSIFKMCFVPSSKENSWSFRETWSKKEFVLAVVQEITNGDGVEVFVSKWKFPFQLYKIYIND